MRTIKSRLAARSIIIAAACAFGLLIPSTAHAIITDFDYFKITTTHADFGNGNLSFGSPTDDAVLLWDWEPVSGDWTTVIDGRMFINNYSGGCVRIEVSYWSSFAYLLKVPSGQLCASDGAMHAVDVEVRYGTYEITEVLIELKQKSSINGPWVTVSSSRQYAN